MPTDVAIIIPSGPGERAWQSLLPSLEAASAATICLVRVEGDAGEVERAPANLRIVESPAGRARQQNTGASASDARWLWFLHADSRVTAATLEAMQRFVEADHYAIGYFRLNFLDDGPRWTVVNAWGARFRSRVLGLPFGDQGLLMPRRVFELLGGFDERIGAGEDHDLVWAARAHGIPLRSIAAPIYTSARKYAKQGWWRTTRDHLALTRDQAGRFSRRHNPAVLP